MFVSVRGLSLVAASGGHSSSRCAGLSLPWPLLLRSTGSRRAGSVVVAHGPSCSAACGIFPDQGSNPCPLHWQADSQPLRHQGSPQLQFCCASFLCPFLVMWRWTSYLTSLAISSSDWRRWALYRRKNAKSVPGAEWLLSTRVLVEWNDRQARASKSRGRAVLCRG